MNKFEDIAQWLHHIGLDAHAAVFSSNDIDLDVLPFLTDGDLREMGLSLGHRKKILGAIRAMGGSSAAPDASPSEAPGKVDDRHPPTESAEAERRQLTVMFCDLVGSTPLSQKLDPEDLRDLLRECQDHWKAAVEKYGGFISRYMGDGALIYFGYPKAQEHDAERAVQAGLDMVDAVGALNQDSRWREADLALRIGIATGLVVVGDIIGEGVARESAVVGETLNLAARLQSAGSPDSVVIGPMTHELIAGRFDCEDLGSLALKGFADPVRAWRVDRARKVESRFEATHGSSAASLVGRQQELNLLIDRWQRACLGEGQIVLLSGEPGIGKSRLLQALYDGIAGTDYERMRFQCSPYHTHSALLPVIARLERKAQFETRDSPQQRIAKLKIYWQEMLGRSEEELPFVASLLSLPLGDMAPPAELSPQRQNERTRELLVDYLCNSSASRYLLVVFEDLHWADPSTIDLLDQLVDAIQTMAVLIVTTFRPVFQPRWTSYRHMTSLTLNRLSRSLSETMVRQTMDAELSVDFIEEIVAKSDGVPLFVEEMTRAVSERLAGAKTEHDARAILDEPVIPATLHDLLLARLDRVSTAKEIAQAASVIGREFSRGLLSSITSWPDSDLDDAMDQLVSAGLVFERRAGTAVLYSFRHALVRDAAYNSLLREARRRWHSRIAAAIKILHPEVNATQPELIAYHHTESGEMNEAIQHWLLAGQHAAARSSNLEAVAHLRRGLELNRGLPPSTSRARQELALQHASCGPVMATTGWGSEESVATYARARELCAELGETEKMLPVLHGQWINLLMSGELLTAREVATQMLGLAGQHEDSTTTIKLHGHRMLAWTMLLMGDFSEVRRNVDISLGLYDPERDGALRFHYVHDARVAGLGCRMKELWLRGDVEDAFNTASTALSYAIKLNHANTLAFALFQITLLAAIERDAEATATHAAEYITLADEQAFRLHHSWGEVVGGWAAAKNGDVADGMKRLRAGIRDLSAGGQRIYLPFYLGLQAEIHIAIGEAADALKALDQAFDLMDRTRERWWEPELHRLTGEASLLQNPNEPGLGMQCFERALACARNAGTKSLELRAATSFAALLRNLGEPDAARATLEGCCSTIVAEKAGIDQQEAAMLLASLTNERTAAENP